jgi:hypothetical protein
MAEATRLSPTRRTYVLVWGLSTVGILIIGSLSWQEIRLGGVGDSFPSLLEFLTSIAAIAAFIFSGAVIVSRQPRNVIGWLLMIPGLIPPAGELLFTWLIRLDPVPTQMDLGLWLAVWFTSWYWVLLIFPIFLILLTFPNGRLISSRWRWVVLLIGVMTAVMLGLTTFGEEMVVSNGEVTVWKLSNPIGLLPVSEQFDAIFFAVWNPLLLLVTLASVAALVVRYRNGTREERKQLAWPLWAVMLFGIVYVGGALGSGFAENSVLDALFYIALVGIPASVAVAVLKHRLYEIDRIISRTLSYTVVVVLSAAVFFGIVVVLSSFLPAESDLAIAGSTLAVAALFNPLRRRVHVWVDRRFNRTRYDAQRVMDRFAGSLRDRLDLEGIVDDWMGVVAETMQPATIAIWTSGER